MSFRGGGGGRKGHRKIELKKIEFEEEQEPQQLSYLQPEILPVDIMVDLLKKRGVKINPQSAERVQIISLFYKNISPKHQRDCRDNRRGKLMKKKRERRLIKCEDEDWKSQVIESKKKPVDLSTKSNVGNNATERLKPPPSCISNDRKKIKLGNSVKDSSSTVTLKKEDSTNGTKQQEKRKPIVEVEVETKKLKLDKTTDSEAKPEKSKEDESITKPNRKSITWP